MIKNGKYFLPPSSDFQDFKELFQRAAAAGVGRPVDSDGFSKGPWTAELLSEAITQLELNDSGIDLRTVQLWYQDNERGISVANIRWLARIFGCNDPIATSEWQVALTDARSRMTSKRRMNAQRSRMTSKQPVVETLDVRPATLTFSESVRLAQTQQEEVSGDYRGVRTMRFNLAVFSENVLSGSPLNISSTVFAGAVALGFMSYFLRIHDVSINTPESVMKQVGFLWSPNWTFLFMVFLPLLLAFVAELLHFWKEEGCLVWGDRDGSSEAWLNNVQSASTTFLVVFVICLLFAGVLQWISIRLMPLLRGGHEYAADWGNVALSRPDVISIPESIFFTGMAYLYMCVCFYAHFAGLILLFIVAQDFHRRQAVSELQSNLGRRRAINVAGIRVVIGVFRCAVLSIMIAVCMKLQSAYLTSSGTNIASWIWGDMVSVFGVRTEFHTVGSYNSPNHFSSLVIVLASTFTFLYAVLRVTTGTRFQVSLWMMMLTIVMLVISYMLIGAFAGFSILLYGGVLLAVFGLINPTFRRGRVDDVGEDQSVS